MAKWYANILITVSPHQAWYVRVKRLTRTWYKKHAYHFATPHTLPYHIHHFPPPSGASQNPAEYHEDILIVSNRYSFVRSGRLGKFLSASAISYGLVRSSPRSPNSQSTDSERVYMPPTGKRKASDASRGGADCQEAERWRRPRAGQEAFGHQRAREGPRRCAKAQAGEPRRRPGDSRASGGQLRLCALETMCTCGSLT